MVMGQENSGRGPTYRAALIAVIILSMLFVVGVVALVIGFMRQYQILQGGKNKVMAAPGGAPAVVELQPGARIVSVQAMQGRLVLHLATPTGGQVEVLDLATGKLLYRVAAPGS